MNDFSGPHITQPLKAWYLSEVQSPTVAPARLLAGQSCLVLDVVDKFATKQKKLAVESTSQNQPLTL